MKKAGRTVLILAAALALASSALSAPAPKSVPKPIIDNDRVTVWDVSMAAGQSTPVLPRGNDAVVMFLEGGTINTRFANGVVVTAARNFGDAQFYTKGSGASDSLTEGGPAHEIIVALKDKPAPPVPNTSRLPLAFPRPGSEKILENDRVIVWRYSWTQGKPTPMHFHDKDVVVAYRYDGTLHSVTPDKTVTENAYKKGDIRFNKANRSHSELLTTARQSAVILELK